MSIKSGAGTDPGDELGPWPPKTAMLHIANNSVKKLSHEKDTYGPPKSSSGLWPSKVQL